MPSRSGTIVANLAGALLAALRVSAGPQDVERAASAQSWLSLPAAQAIGATSFTLSCLAPLLFLLVLGRFPSFRSWRGLLGSAVVATALFVLSPIMVAVAGGAEPFSALVLVGSVLALALGLGASLRRGAPWARWLLVGLGVLSLVGAIAASGVFFADDPGFAWAVALPLVATPAFGCAVLLHPDVAAAFARRRSRLVGRVAAASGWRHVVPPLLLLSGLGTAATMVMLVDRMAEGEPAITVLGAVVVALAAVLMILVSTHLWRGVAWARRGGMVAAALSSLGFLGLAIRGLLSESDPVDLLLLTGFVSLVPAFLLFLVAVLRHPDVVTGFSPSGAAGAPRAAAATAASLALLLAGVVGEQRGRAASEEDRLATRLASVRTEVQQVERVAVRLEEFKEVVEGLEGRIDRVRRLLPRELDAEGFAATLMARAQDLGVSIELQEVTAESLDLYDQARLALRLEGDPGRIARLVADVEAGLPLAVWRTDEADPAAAEVTLFALPAPVRRAPPALCAPRREVRWLWPFDAGVERLRNDLESACSRLERLAVVRGEIQHYESQHDWLEAALDLAKRLRATQATYSARPGEEKPEPDPS